MGFLIIGYEQTAYILTGNRYKSLVFSRLQTIIVNMSQRNQVKSAKGYVPFCTLTVGTKK
jgi:hypothetical protein